MMSETDNKLEQAYQFCINLAHNHYENFPVASLLVAKQLRRPISVIYAFARTADDIADEGDLEPAERNQQLEQYQAALDTIQNQSYQNSDPIFIALEDVINRYGLPIELFYDLLNAFQQDVQKSRYQNMQDIFDYCRCSANPIGRLLLYLNDKPSQQQLQQSDALCTALQLINFFQDIEQDLTENNRLYLPLQDFSDKTITQCITDNDTTELAPVLRRYYINTQQIIDQSRMLTSGIKGRLAWEIRAITLSGLVSLKRLSQQTDNAMFSRPRLSNWHLFIISTMSISNYLYIKFTDKLHSQITTYNSQ